jgi:hypothetical protein
MIQESLKSNFKGGELMNGLIEVSEINQLTGRTPVKVVLHEIHKDKNTNKNGIHWKREYVEKNMKTAINAPLVAEFLDDDFDIPLGHGDVNVDEEGNVYFENSVVVGVIEDVEITSLEINGEMKDVLLASGVLFNQRFPNFVKWLKETSKNQKVYSSVEIGANPPNKTIIYEGEYSKEFRIPMDYQYTGHSFLTETPADNSSVLVEINQYRNQYKEVKKMSDKNEKVILELNEKIESKTNEINQLKDELKQKESAVSELNEKLETKQTELNAAVEELNEVKQKLEQSESKLQEVESELNELRKFKQDVENQKLVAELNEKLAKYTDEEKEVVKEKVETFQKQPSKDLMNEIISEINSHIAQQILAKRQKEGKKSEVNSVQVDDIYGDVIDVNDDNLDDIY